MQHCSFIDVQSLVLTETTIRFLIAPIIAPIARNVSFLKLRNFKYKNMSFNHCRLRHSLPLQHLSFFYFPAECM